MNILCIGDVVGIQGCNLLRDILPGVKKQYNIDVCIVNGENSANGNGTTPVSANHLFDSGADVITGGNHTFRRPEFIEFLDSTPAIIRPANYPPNTPGVGMYVIDRGSYQLTVVNMIGLIYMQPNDCPFRTIDYLLEKAGNPKFCIVDFHAEATSEKKALGYYCDGRVSAVVGTHTHVQTADEQILPNGTGYITDLGMTGPIDSVLGVKSQLSIQKMKSRLPVRFETAEGNSRMNSVVITLDDQTGKATSISRLNIE